MIPTSWMQHVAQRALCSFETLQATETMARDVLARDIPGDFAEAGVFAGAQCAVMARVLAEVDPMGSRVVHLYDSFAGIPESGPNDIEYRAAGHAAGLSAQRLDWVQMHMQQWGVPERFLVYHPGMFADTLPISTGRLAMLRIDCDLYESAKLVIQHLYPRVSIGGWIVADDFELTGERQAIFEKLIPSPIYWRRG